MNSNSGRELQTIASGGIGGVFLVLGLLASGSAQASECSVTGGSIGLTSGTCGYVAARAQNQYYQNLGVPFPTNYGYAPTGSASVLAEGYGGEGVATVSTSPGQLHVYARASEGSSLDNANANASAIAAMAEGGIIDSPGGTLGDPVHAIVTLDVEGTLSGQAFLYDSHFYFSSTHEGSIENNFSADRLIDPNVPKVLTFTAHIGDDAFLEFGLEVQAVGAYGFGHSPFSLADFGNTGRLFIDFEEEGVSFKSNSGHDYSSAAAVPAPPAVWLLGTAVAGLGGRRLMRRKNSS